MTLSHTIHKKPDGVIHKLFFDNNNNDTIKFNQYKYCTILQSSLESLSFLCPKPQVPGFTLRTEVGKDRPTGTHVTSRLFWNHALLVNLNDFSIRSRGGIYKTNSTKYHSGSLDVKCSKGPLNLST